LVGLQAIPLILKGKTQYGNCFWTQAMETEKFGVAQAGYLFEGEVALLMQGSCGGFAN
jgi:hypothetical protein